MNADRNRDRPLRLALVGAGGIAQAYLETVATLAAVDFVAVVDPVPERAKAAAARCDAIGFASLDDLLVHQDRLDIDGVVICTPPSTHKDLAIAALDANLPVLCEKPLAPNRADAHQMQDAAISQDQLLMMASKFRYVEDVTSAKARIEAGDLGEIVLFRNAFTSIVAMADRWNSDPAASGGGVIIDNGTHSVDIARYLLGPLRDVVATHTKHIQHLAVEDSAQILFRTQSSATGTIDLSWSLNTGSPWYCTIDGSLGSLRLGWQTAELFHRDCSRWETVGRGYNKAEALLGELLDFCHAITYGTEPVTSVEDAMASVMAIDAMYASIRSGTWEPVIEERRRSPRPGSLARARRTI